MLLRSSSTPVLGSLLSSFTDCRDSPCNVIHSEINHLGKHLPPLPTTTVPHKLSLYQTASLNLSSSFSCNSSPISPSISELDRNRGFIRRAQSDGNLKDLAYVSSSTNKSLMALHTIPSFSFSNCKGLREEDEESEFEEVEGVELNAAMIVTHEGLRDEKGSCIVGFGQQKMDDNKEMYLAMRLGIEGCCGNGIGGCRGGGGGGFYNSMWSKSGGDDGERNGVEEYYKKMVDENPGNPLFLRNYAQFLYECKRDHERAEEYYSRAILADPKDGEVLSQYGKLVWEVHHDQNTASTYFERAVQASPQDSHVHAAYASFLWDTEEDEDSCDQPQCLPPHLQHGAMVVSAGA